LKKRLEGYIEMRADGDLTREQFQDKKASTEAELKRLSYAIDDLQEQIQSLDKEVISNQYETKIKRIKQFNEIYQNGDLEECNRLLKLIINKVHYARVNDRITITSPLEGYMEVENGDFVDLSIEQK
jgi:site-specific DNA recombinase